MFCRTTTFFRLFPQIRYFRAFCGSVHAVVSRVRSFPCVPVPRIRSFRSVTPRVRLFRFVQLFPRIRSFQRIRLFPKLGCFHECLCVRSLPCVQSFPRIRAFRELYSAVSAYSVTPCVRCFRDSVVPKFGFFGFGDLNRFENGFQLAHLLDKPRHFRVRADGYAQKTV